MKLAKTALVVVLSVFMSWTFGQSLNDAGMAFNEGIRLSKEEDVKGALMAYENCIVICDSLGVEGDELKTKSQNQIVSIHTNLGTKAYKAKKPNAAIYHLKDALSYAEASGNAEGVAKAKKYLGYSYTYWGNVNLKEEAYDKAIENFNEAINYAPESIKAYYGMGVAYLKTDDGDKMKASMDKVIAMGKEDDKTVAKAKSVAGKYYLSKSGKLLEKLKYKEAIQVLNTSMEYISDNANTYYYLTLAYNNTNAFDKAIEVGEKGLVLASESPFNQYFELGRAYEGQGEKKKACENYKKVTEGPNVEAAKYERETVLKCN